MEPTGNLDNPVMKMVHVVQEVVQEDRDPILEAAREEMEVWVVREGRVYVSDQVGQPPMVRPVKMGWAVQEEREVSKDWVCADFQSLLVAIKHRQALAPMVLTGVMALMEWKEIQGIIF